MPFPLSQKPVQYCFCDVYKRQSYEDAFCAELHHESRIGRSGHAAGSKVDDGEFLMVMDVEDKRCV